MKKMILVLFCIFGLTSCALAPPQLKARIPTQESERSLGVFLEGRMRDCWERDWSFWKDGIKIDSRMPQEPVRISASRYSPDIGVADPFFIIRVLTNSDGISEVVIEEGEYLCKMSGSCYELDIAADVERWMRGDKSCRTALEQDEN